MCHEDLIPYYFTVLKQAKKFKGFFIIYIPRAQNAYADALASLVISLALLPGAETMIPVTESELYYSKLPIEESSDKTMTGEVCTTSMELEFRDWRFPYIDYVVYGILPDNSKKAAAIKRKALIFYYDAVSQILYHKLHDGVLLRCFSRKEAKKAFKEAHNGMCGAHKPGAKLGDRFRRISYY
ncbi:uncharacterized protein LOC109839009 [Asparagus officinalis]|uniref:uncharacterized protein LOC109839009 n=1 Tax=Asparagus officinalis TaxID=4686 RepID=UPI00098DF26B|nr:uncharacterized protein LOC109839009 [Asparagus officinalis]